MNRGQFLTWLAGSAVGAMTGGALAAAMAGAEPNAPVTVLARATVIDGTGGPPHPDTTVVLAGDRIVAVGRFPDLPMPVARTVDLHGKFVIPGLWDIHTHVATAERTFPPMYLAYGVTGIREMWGFPETHSLRRRIEGGELIGPRMVVASSIIDGPPVLWPGSEGVATDAEARAAVRRAHGSGADFVKVYSQLSRETFAAIADESRRVGLRFAGHVPYRIPVHEAIEAGQYTLEHMYGMLTAASARAVELQAEIEAMPAEPGHPDGWVAQRARLEREAAETYDPARAASLSDLMIGRGCWQSPTLVVQRRVVTGMGYPPPEDPDAEDMLRRYLPESIRQFWWSYRTGPSTPEQIAEREFAFRVRLELLGAMAAAGAGIVAGTDAGNPYAFPGYSLHEELELLVRAGLTPMRALQAATRDAARCAGLEHLSGTVAPGKFADLVVLDADPLAGIGNTRRIHAVVSRGRYLSGADRERILREVETAAQEPSPPFAPGGSLGPCCG
ncbi:amidohydrolase family protein [Nocardia sp. NPDC050793]|uniref:amidohydrolase family protein n=1 Tax=Nocardia sp. NPDC050793 TaxID=3155159 RepID=UPI0033C8186E